MTLRNETKINHLLQSLPSGTVYLSKFLNRQNVSRALVNHYVKSGWLEKLGSGAYKRKGEHVDVLGGLYAIQTHAEKAIHVGGMSALALHGLAHYLRSELEIELFSPKRQNLPAWFANHKWDDAKVTLHKTEFLPLVEGSLQSYKHNSFEVLISSPERAILEALYLCPKHHDMVEVYQTLEGMVNLRPKLMQKLLEECSHVKVKRLFLYMAKKAQHQWYQFLNLNNIDLGKGKRSLDKGWVYIAEYKINVPKELDDL